MYRANNQNSHEYMEAKRGIVYIIMNLHVFCIFVLVAGHLRYMLSFSICKLV